MPEKIFNALVKNDRDEALSAFKDAIQQKVNTAMDVRRVGLTSQIFNDGNHQTVPVVEEEVQIGEAFKASSSHHHVLKGKVVASGNKSDMMKLVKKNGATVFKGSNTNYVLYSPGSKVGDVQEEVQIDEAVSADKFVKGGSDKIKQSEVDTLLGKIYDNTKLTKSLIANKAYSDGESNPKKKNPHQKDTVDFHLFQLGQQVELSRS
jgi:hypothetical protein